MFQSTAVQRNLKWSFHCKVVLYLSSQVLERMYDTHFPCKLWRKASRNYILIIYKMFLRISNVVIITYILHSVCVCFLHTNKFLTKFVRTFRICLFIKWKAILRLEKIPTDNGDDGATLLPSLAPTAFSFGLPHPAKVLVTSDGKTVKWFTLPVDSIGFWWWCITDRITGFSDFVHRPDSKLIRRRKKEKTRRFGNWICFRPQVRGDTYSVGSLRKS
jgi:hypothetical protein